MTAAREDRDLIARILAGDRESLDNLFSLYFPKVCNFVSLRVADRRLTEVLSETILTEAVNAFERYDGSMSLDRWMLQITGEVLDFQQSAFGDRIAEAI